MTEAADDTTKEAYEGAVKSFTEAEVALREIVHGLERFRAASELVAGAGESLDETRAALVRSSSAVELAVVSLTTVAGSLAVATRVIADLDPSRIWDALGRMETSAAASTSAIREGIGAGFAREAAERQASAAALESSAAARGESASAELRAAAAGIEATIGAGIGSTQAAITASGSSIEAALASSKGDLTDRISGASDAVTASTRASADALQTDLGLTRSLVVQVRILAAAAAGIGALAVALLVLLLLR